jgi:uncharacterized repeat protein (TIGR01451 family)
MAIERVRYTERQILHAQDLADEQGYRAAGQRRHLAGQHSWGIVQGLRLRATPEGFVVLPGYAVDGLGRELAVPLPIFTPWAGPGESDLFDLLGSDRFGASEQAFIDVWLRYAPRSADPRPARGECRPAPPLRWRDEAAICLSEVLRAAATDGPPPVRVDAPPFVSQTLRAPAPHEALGAEPDGEWPVFLGRLRRERLEAESAAGFVLVFAVEQEGRPYAGLVGAAISSASTVAVAEDPENLPKAAPPPAPSAQIAARRAGDRRRVTVTIADGRGALADAITLDTLSGAAIRGATRLIGPAPGAGLERDQAADLLLPDRLPLIEPGDIRDAEALACRLEDPAALPMNAPPAGKGEARLARGPQTRYRSLLRQAALPGPAGEPSATPAALARRLNRWIGAATPLGPVTAGRSLRGITRRMLGATGRQRALARRFLLEDLFPDELTPRAHELGAYGVELRPPPAPEPPAAPPAPAPAPWRVSHVVIKRDGAEVRQLRFELGATGDKLHPERNQLTVGRWVAEPPGFAPYLTVDEACHVTIDGTLTVTGDVIRRPPPADEQGLIEQLAEQWQQGGGPGPIGQNLLTATISDPGAIKAGATWAYDVTVANGGTAPASFISVLEQLSVGGSFVTRTVASIPSLPPQQNATRRVSHPMTGDPPIDAAAASVVLMITVIGFDANFNAIYASAGRTVPIVP